MLLSLLSKIAGSERLVHSGWVYGKLAPEKPSHCNNEEIGYINDKIENGENYANLVFPCPKKSTSNFTKYASLASFVRSASDEVPLLFQKAAEKLDENLENKVFSNASWYLSSTSVSTGTITNWVHLRIDPSPKFCRYNPYKMMT